MLDQTTEDKSTKITWSTQQQAFLDWCEDPDGGSCVLVAVAGAGKTTVLLEGGQRIAGGVAYVAYNRKIVDETKKKLSSLGVDWKKMQANTAHGFGYAAYRKARPNVKIDKDNQKVYAILEAMIKDEATIPHIPAMRQLISLAKQRALGVIGSIDSVDEWLDMIQHFDVFEDEDEDTQGLDVLEIVRLCQEALRLSNSQLDLIDFDDMIYLPLLHRVRFWKHDVVMVDEAQDTNPARRALVRAMLQRGGRMIAVGDPHQAIYGFTGADAGALDLIARDFNCQHLNLTITYRCPKKVVAFAQQWVSHIVAAPTAPEGEVSKMSMESFLQRNDLTGDCAVLSRTTKPLVALAFALIRQHKPCRIEGRDVGKSLQRLMTRWKVTGLLTLLDRLDTYLARETTKLLAAKKEAKLQQVEDAVETVRVIIDQCLAEKKTQVSDAVAYVDQLFGDDISDILTLSTIHKSKGREFHTVYWLDRVGTCPSKWARQEWQQDQEKNLCYVAATRAKEKLVELAAPVKEKRSSTSTSTGTGAE